MRQIPHLIVSYLYKAYSYEINGFKIENNLFEILLAQGQKRLLF